MVAGHMRKRLNGGSVELTVSSSWDYSRTKTKKKLESLKSELNAKSHISLEWDGMQKKVIAKRDQVCLCHRDLRSFINSVPQHRNVLADVLSVPHEIFGLESMKEVLSYEVWQNCLSKNERSILEQFLPGGLDREEVVRALLIGENFHFGNPFLKWGSFLCSGNLHPDTVSHQEVCLVAGKRAHYSQIQKYHIDMINLLQNLKEAWESSKDPEDEVSRQTLRLRRGSQKKNPKERDRFHDCDDNVAGTSDSCSLFAEAKAHSSDCHKLLLINGRSSKKGIHEKGLAKEKHKKLFVALNGAKRGDKPKNGNINHSDGAEYMSYLKISKKQLDLVKSMKQSGNIQAKSLNSILGNVDTLHVRPYEEFVKEEERKLRDHWLQVAVNDLPAAYVKWKEAQLQKGEIINALVQEMEERLKPLLEDEVTDNCEILIQDQNNQGERRVEAIEEDDGQEEQEDQNDQGTISDRTSEECDEQAGSSSCQDQNDQGVKSHETSVENYDDAASGSPQSQSPGQMSFLSSGHDPDPMNVESENILVTSKSDGSSPHRSECSMNANTPVDTLGAASPFFSDGNWHPRDAKKEDSLTTRGASVSSGGSLHSANTTDAGASTQGVPIFSCGDVYVVDVSTADDSISHPVSISSVGDMYPFDTNDANASLNQRVPITSDGDLYPVDANKADDWLGQGVSNISVGNMYSLDANTSLGHRVPFSQVSGCLQDANNSNASIGQGAMAYGGDWSIDNMRHSYCNSTGKEDYGSSHSLPLPRQINRQQHPQLIDLECVMDEEDMGKDILQRHCEESSYSYPNHDRSGLLQSMFNGRRISDRQERKHTRSDLQSPNNVLLRDGLFSGNVPGNLQTLMPMELGKKRISDNYVNQNATDERYPNGGGFLIPRQAHVPPVNLPDWAVNPVCMPTQIQSHLPYDGMLTQNWFPSEQQVRGGWSRPNGFAVPSQTFGNNVDQSIYSVLSHCNQLRSERHIDSMGPNQQFMLVRNFGMVGRDAPRVDNHLPQAPNPLDCLGGRDMGSSLMPDDMGWMNLPQNSTLQDTMGKPYLRSWNQ